MALTARSLPTRRGLPAWRTKKRARPGAAPGTLIADPGAKPPVINLLIFDAAHLVEQKAVPRDELKDLVPPEDGVLWIDVNGLGDVDLIETLGDVFNLHRLALEDVLNVHQRPKAEDYDSYVFVTTRMVEPGRDERLEQLSLFFGQGFVITFQERVGDCFDPVRARLRAGKGRIRKNGADYLAYALLDAALDSYFPLLEHLGEQLDELEDAVLERPDHSHIEKLHGMKRRLLGLRRAIWPQREMIAALTRDEMPMVKDNTRLFLRDNYDHTIQLVDMVETYREIASGLIEVYLSSLSTRMNDVMKVLTLIATIFMPLSFIAGVYGMNFDTSASPWNMPELRWRFGYPLVIALMAMVALGLLLYFKRQGWMNRAGRP